jgi:hypothetical protein
MATIDKLYGTGVDAPVQTTLAQDGLNASSFSGQQVFFNDLDSVGYSNGTNFINLYLSRKIKTALRPLTLADGPLRLVVQGDSTGNATDEWVYLTAQAMAAKYPAHTHNYRLWDDTTQQYLQPTLLATGTSGLAHVLTGSAATSWNLQVADSAATSIVGDIDVRAKIDLNGARFSAQSAICAKYGAAGQRSWRLESDTSGKLFFEWTADGTTTISGLSTSAISSALWAVGAGAFWARVTLDVDNGAAGYDLKFYTSTDGTTWSQVGTTIVGGTTTSIFDSTTSTQLIGRGGGSLAQQNHNISFYELEVYGSLDGTSRVIDIDVGAANKRDVDSAVSSSTFYDDLGNLVTIAQNDNGTLEGSPRFALFNSSHPGAQISYSHDATRYPKQIVGVPQITMISYSHNHSTDIEFRTDYKTLTDKLLTTNPDMCVIALSQNRKIAPATNIREHAIRCQQIANFSASQGFEFIDVYAALDDADTTDVDGIHPLPAGSIKWSNIVKWNLGI